MNCERVAQLLPDYLQGMLGHNLDDQLEDHFEQCASCKEMVRLWNEMALLPEEQPSPALGRRFEALLGAYQEGRRSAGGSPVFAPVGWTAWLGGGWARPATAFALGLVLLAGGFSVGWYGKGKGNGSQNDLAAVHAELRSMRQLVVLSMLQQQSASERLQGVSWSMKKGTSDPRVLDALLNTLRYDANVDVRLAALRALSNYRDEPLVRAGLLESLQPHQSPLVQVELIELLVELRAAGAVTQLQKMRQDRNLNPVVRERADWALAKLN